MKNDNIWVIIPAHNESKRINSVIIDVKKYISNIILVDDGSNDNTYNIAKKHNIFVLKHIINLGKGAALKTGCDFALKNNAEKMIALDADGQHDPNEIPYFLEELKRYDVVFGYRTFNKDMPFVFKFGNNFINSIIKILYGIKLKDTQCGYRAFTSNAYKKIRWNANDYSMESEMIANMGKRHLKYKELPIKTIYADKYKGTTIFDGIKIVLNMFLWRLKR